MGTEQLAEDSADVVVFLNDEKAVKQPEGFRCCPLGIQFFSEKPVEQYRIVSFRLEIPQGQNSSSVECAGTIVKSIRDDDSGMYRNWISFLDIPDEIRSDLECKSRESGLFCPYCQNY
ncbi:MAG: hypothetical protein KJ626_03065 [Verrucomicrobia bacterium]|nr:hypothetical protein [Verrucomicrobiota bacterium]